MSNALLDKLIWVFIYGGLLSLGLGLAVWGDAGGWGMGLAIGGGLAAALGFGLIGVRSRRPGD